MRCHCQWVQPTTERSGLNHRAWHLRCQKLGETWFWTASCAVMEDPETQLHRHSRRSQPTTEPQSPMIKMWSLLDWKMGAKWLQTISRVVMADLEGTERMSLPVDATNKRAVKPQAPSLAPAPSEAGRDLVLDCFTCHDGGSGDPTPSTVPVRSTNCRAAKPEAQSAVPA